MSQDVTIYIQSDEEPNNNKKRGTQMVVEEEVGDVIFEEVDEDAEDGTVYIEEGDDGGEEEEEEEEVEDNEEDDGDIERYRRLAAKKNSRLVRLKRANSTTTLTEKKIGMVAPGTGNDFYMPRVLHQTAEEVLQHRMGLNDDGLQTAIAVPEDIQAYIRTAPFKSFCRIPSIETWKRFWFQQSSVATIKNAKPNDPIRLPYPLTPLCVRNRPSWFDLHFHRMVPLAEFKDRDEVIKIDGKTILSMVRHMEALGDDEEDQYLIVPLAIYVVNYRSSGITCPVFASLTTPSSLFSINYVTDAKDPEHRQSLVQREWFAHQTLASGALNRKGFVLLPDRNGSGTPLHERMYRLPLQPWKDPSFHVESVVDTRSMRRRIRSSGRITDKDKNKKWMQVKIPPEPLFSKLEYYIARNWAGFSETIRNEYKDSGESRDYVTTDHTDHFMNLPCSIAEKFVSTLDERTQRHERVMNTREFSLTLSITPDDKKECELHLKRVSDIPSMKNPQVSIDLTVRVWYMSASERKNIYSYTTPDQTKSRTTDSQ